MAFLVVLIGIGYYLSKKVIVPDHTERILSKLENAVFIPALVLGTFMDNFTVEKLSTTWQYLLGGVFVVVISIPAAIFISRKLVKDEYIQKIYTYGLAFSNFGFMGNAVVMALFPDFFMDYLVLTLPFWIMIYLWAVPSLLIPSDGPKKTLKDRLRSFVNPMIIATFIGMIIGLIAPPLPTFISSSISSLGNCMSPIAMLLTGMTVAKIDLKTILKNTSIYQITAVRLLAFPAVLLLIFLVLPLPYGVAACMLCAVSMPLGLNTIVVPSAYGQDTSVAAGMALISHLLSCLSIPLVFTLFEWIVGR